MWKFKKSYNSSDFLEKYFSAKSMHNSGIFRLQKTTYFKNKNLKNIQRKKNDK
jgi:hypothetical protein